MPKWFVPSFDSLPISPPKQIDVGQPLRAWFTFWHPNVHSMLTEVTFCLTLYLSVLAIE